jgi:hypothetical protein
MRTGRMGPNYQPKKGEPLSPILANLPVLRAGGYTIASRYDASRYDKESHRLFVTGQGETPEYDIGLARRVYGGKPLPLNEIIYTSRSSRIVTILCGVYLRRLFFYRS